MPHGGDKLGHSGCRKRRGLTWKGFNLEISEDLFVKNHRPPPPPSAIAGMCVLHTRPLLRQVPHSLAALRFVGA